MSYNVKVLLLIAAAIVGILAFAMGFFWIATVGGAGFAIMFFLTFRQMRQMEAADRVIIEARFQELKSSLANTQALAIKKLATCTDAALVTRVNEKLADAASHLGSNPAWRNTRRIVSGADVISWYQDGIAKVGEAKQMIDDYVSANPSAGGAGDARQQ